MIKKYSDWDKHEFSGTPYPSDIVYFSPHNDGLAMYYLSGALDAIVLVTH